MSKQTKHEAVKKQYIEGHNIADIARTCGVSRTTIYRMKKKDLDEGVDWDTLALAHSRDISNIKQSEETFVFTLIQSFEKALEEIEALPAEKQLPLLKEYSATYYKLKAPLKSDCKALALRAVTNALNTIANLAKKSKNTSVQNFLSDNADEILSKVLKA